MKLTDIIVSVIIKRGIIYEARNVNVEFTIPNIKTDQIDLSQLKGVKIQFKADHMILKIDKEGGA